MDHLVVVPASVLVGQALVVVVVLAVGTSYHSRAEILTSRLLRPATTVQVCNKVFMPLQRQAGILCTMLDLANHVLKGQPDHHVGEKFDRFVSDIQRLHYVLPRFCATLQLPIAVCNVYMSAPSRVCKKASCWLPVYLEHRFMG